jgi:hypothetical protein
MVMEEKEKIEQPKETIEDSEISLSEIYNTIHRQIIGLASSVAFYNLQQTLQKPEEKPLVITVGGLQYTGNQENLKRTYLLEQKYWTKFLSLPVDDSDKNFTEKSTPNVSAKATPSENFSSGNSEEEEKISKVFLSEDFYSYPLPWEEEDPEEEDPEEEDPEEDEKISDEKSDLEEEDDAEDENKKILIPPAAEDDVSLRKEGTARDDVVLLQRNPQYRLFPNDAVLCKRNDAVSCAIEKALPSALSPNGAVSSLDRVIRPAPRLLEHARKKAHDPIQTPFRSGPKWKHTARKSVLRAQAQAQIKNAQAETRPAGDRPVDARPAPAPLTRPYPKTGPSFNPRFKRSGYTRSGPAEINRPVHLNRPVQGKFTKFHRSGSFQLRFGPFKNRWNADSKGYNSTGTNYCNFNHFKQHYHRNNWERGESSNQSHRSFNRRFIRPSWLAPTEHKEVAFTIPDLSRAEITSDRRVRGPHPLRIVRTVEQSPRDSWPISIHRYTPPRTGERVSPPNPNSGYYRGHLNKYKACLTYPAED